MIIQQAIAVQLKRLALFEFGQRRQKGLEIGRLVEHVLAVVPTIDELSPLAKVRQRKWAEKVHQPMEQATVDAIRRSSATGLPYGDEAWVKRLAKRLKLDLTIRPRGRPRKHVVEAQK